MTLLVTSSAISMISSSAQPNDSSIGSVGDEVEDGEGSNWNDDQRNIERRLPWMYPEDQLVASGTRETIEMVKCSIVDDGNNDENKGKPTVELQFENGDKEGVELDGDIGEWKIEIVTNSNSLKLVSNKENKNENDVVVVTPDDIGEAGQHKDQDKMNEWLREHEIDTDHFSVHFFFAEPQKGR